MQGLPIMSQIHICSTAVVFELCWCRFCIDVVSMDSFVYTLDENVPLSIWKWIINLIKLRCQMAFIFLFQLFIIYFKGNDHSALLNHQDISYDLFYIEILQIHYKFKLLNRKSSRNHWGWHKLEVAWQLSVHVRRQFTASCR